MEKMYEADDEIEIDLREIFYALRSKIWVIILAFMIGGIAAVLYSEVILTPMYSSTTMVYILSKETTLTSLADLQIGSQLTKDYRVVLEVVLNDTIKTEEDVEKYLQLSVLSSIPERKDEVENRRKKQKQKAV